MRRFDASDEHRSIKQIELQMAQLSATVNTRQLGTLPSNTVQNPKNDGHCMEIITRGGKQTIDPPMPSDDKVVEVDAELEDNTAKDAEVPKKVTLMPRHHLHFLKDY